MKELTKELVEERLSLWMIHVRSTSKQTATVDKTCNLQKFGILTYLVSAKSESEAIEGFHSIFYNEKFPRIVGIVNITNDSIIDEQYQEDWTDDEHKLIIKRDHIPKITKDLIYNTLTKIIYFDSHKNHWAMKYYITPNIDIMNLVSIDNVMFYYVSYDRKELLSDDMISSITSQKMIGNAQLSYDFVTIDFMTDSEFVPMLIHDDMNKDNDFHVFVVDADEISVSDLQKMKNILSEMKRKTILWEDVEYYSCALYVVSEGKLYNIPLIKNHLVLEEVEDGINTFNNFTI